jgi:hypothetical protein
LEKAVQFAGCWAPEHVVHRGTGKATARRRFNATRT